jgi:hypothetical protein
MFRCLAFLSALVVGGPVWASYSCDGANDQLIGTLTTSRAYPLTIALAAKIATHPAAAQTIAQLGTTPGAITNSVQIRLQASADTYGGESRDGSGSGSTASVTDSNDGQWGRYVATFNNATTRVIHADSQANNGSEATSRAIGTALNDVSLCELLNDTQDFLGLVAEVCFVDTAIWTSQQITDYMNGVRCDVVSPTSALFGYYKLDTNNATQPNDGSDATGDLTVSGATFSTDNPSFGPVFTAGPSEAAATNGHTISGTVTCAGTCTVYAVSTNPGAADPSCTQVKAGQDGSSVAARHSANEVWTTAVGDSFALTEAGNAPESDVHICASDGTTDTAVTSLANQLRSPDASQAITELTSVAATSPFALQTVTGCDVVTGSFVATGCGAMAWLQPGMQVDLSAGWADLTNVNVVCAAGIGGTCAATEIEFEIAANGNATNFTVTQDAYYSPTVAADDTIEGNTTTSGGGTITVGVDGSVSCAGTCSGYQTWTYNIQDVSHATTGNFTSGPPAWGTDDLMHLFSSRPELDAGLQDTAFLFYVGVALSGVTLGCTDVDGQTTSVTSRSSPPTGTSIATSGAWTGTATVEAETAAELILDCADTGLLYSIPQSIPVYVTDDAITAPDCVGDTAAECVAELAVVRGWLGDEEQLTEDDSSCSPTVPSGDIISQLPAAAGTLAAEDDPLLVVVSTGVCASGSRSGVSLGFGSFGRLGALGGSGSGEAGGGGAGGDSFDSDAFDTDAFDVDSFDL